MIGRQFPIPESNLFETHYQSPLMKIGYMIRNRQDTIKNYSSLNKVKILSEGQGDCTSKNNTWNLMWLGIIKGAHRANECKSNNRTDFILIYAITKIKSLYKQFIIDIKKVERKISE